MTVRITALRDAISRYIVEDWVERHYIKDQRNPTARQLVAEIMDEIEPAILAIKAALDKRRTNLENY